MTDLIVLCADKKIQASVEAVLSRYQAIGIRAIHSVVEVMVGKNDPGCFHNAHGYLAPPDAPGSTTLLSFSIGSGMARRTCPQLTWSRRCEKDCCLFGVSPAA